MAELAARQSTETTEDIRSGGGEACFAGLAGVGWLAGWLAGHRDPRS